MKKMTIFLALIVFASTISSASGAGLKKAVTLPGGIDVVNAHHSIADFHANGVDKILEIEIAIYKDKATKVADASDYIPGQSKKLVIVEDDFMAFFTTVRPSQSLQSSIYDALYQWIKANNAYYSDAVDDN